MSLYIDYVCGSPGYLAGEIFSYSSPMQVFLLVLCSLVTMVRDWQVLVTLSDREKG